MQIPSEKIFITMLAPKVKMHWGRNVLKSKQAGVKKEPWFEMGWKQAVTTRSDATPHSLPLALDISKKTFKCFSMGYIQKHMHKKHHKIILS